MSYKSILLNLGIIIAQLAGACAAMALGGWLFQKARTA